MMLPKLGKIWQDSPNVATFCHYWAHGGGEQGSGMGVADGEVPGGEGEFTHLQVGDMLGQ